MLPPTFIGFVCRQVSHTKVVNEYEEQEEESKTAHHNIDGNHVIAENILDMVHTFLT